MRLFISERKAHRRTSSPGQRRCRLAVEQLESRITPSTLIPVSDARALVYDASRN